ncbi:DUF2793 domain-containing protein [Aureimonas mangrovi]|uniref:DUF2793 domain-containing protein n=1 Tax=Aureimonas mangrovi TaxID=2758041 RepID=UPI00163DE0BC|nr:DUF2793 domain-containing protein [Aureimonas mangrovi]
MEQSTPNLDLPYILPSQAQKHVTHNEALATLDALVQLAVIDRDRTVPPEHPTEGERHIVADGASGVWAGQERGVATWRDGAWLIVRPRIGWLAFVEAEDLFCRFVDGGWSPIAETVDGLQHLERLGIGTAADPQNPFSARLNKALWAARAASDGGDGDLRLVMNKEASANTASLLFQSGWSGRAEIGLTGSDDLSVKVSADGATWRTAFGVNHQSGTVDIPASVRFDGAVSCGASGIAPGVMHIHRQPGEAAIVLSAGANSAAPEYVGQLRARPGVGIALTNGSSSWWGLAVNTQTNRVGIGTTEPVHKLTVADGAVGPATDNAHPVGSATRRWSTIYAATGAINTSDARDKNVEGPIGASAARIVDAVAPILYRWKIGGMEVVETGVEKVPDGEDAQGNEMFVERTLTEERPRAGVRRHAGWLAQDVRAAFEAEGLDCGAWGLDEPEEAESRQWLRPDQLTAFLWEALRETRRDLAELKDRQSR